MSILIGTLILIVVAESLIGRGTLWMPDFLRRREISRGKFDPGVRPLAFVAFGVTAPALGGLALGLGLMACGGPLVLLGYALAAVTAYVLFVSL